MRRAKAVLVLLTVILMSGYVYGAQSHFGSENYKTGNDESFYIGIYIEAEENIDKAYTDIRYDTEGLTFLAGATEKEPGLIQAEFETEGKSAKCILRFRGISAGCAGIATENIKAYRKDGSEIIIDTKPVTKVSISAKRESQVEKIVVNGVTVGKYEKGIYEYDLKIPYAQEFNVQMEGATEVYTSVSATDDLNKVLKVKAHTSSKETYLYRINIHMDEKPEKELPKETVTSVPEEVLLQEGVIKNEVKMPIIICILAGIILMFAKKTIRKYRPEKKENKKIMKEVWKKTVRVFGRLKKWFKRLKKWQKASIITAGTIVTLAVALVLTVLIMIASGKASIYSKASSNNINMLKNEVIVQKGDDGTYVKVDGNGEIIGTTVAGQTADGTTTDQTETTKKEPQTTIEFNPETGTAKVDGEEYRYNDNLINFLVIGIDRQTEAESGGLGTRSGQADTIFLVTLNPDKKEIEMLTIHRNAIVVLEVYDLNGEFEGYAEGQICLQHAYSGNLEEANKLQLKVVSKLLYNLPIHSVTSINMAGVPQMNDAIGGVTVNSLETFETNGYSFKKGESVKLTGMKAYWYVRYRNLYEKNTAAQRMERQKQYIQALASQAISQLKSNPLKIVDVYNVIDEYVVTDITLDEMAYLGSEVSGYTFKGVNTLTAEPSTDPKWRYERIYLDENEIKQYIIDHFCEKVK